MSSLSAAPVLGSVCASVSVRLCLCVIHLLSTKYLQKCNIFFHQIRAPSLVVIVLQTFRFWNWCNSKWLPYRGNFKKTYFCPKLKNYERYLHEIWFAARFMFQTKYHVSQNQQNCITLRKFAKDRATKHHFGAQPFKEFHISDCCPRRLTSLPVEDISSLITRYHRSPGLSLCAHTLYKLITDLYWLTDWYRWSFASRLSVIELFVTVTQLQRFLGGHLSQDYCPVQGSAWRREGCTTCMQGQVAWVLDLHCYNAAEGEAKGGG